MKKSTKYFEFFFDARVCAGIKTNRIPSARALYRAATSSSVHSQKWKTFRKMVVSTTQQCLAYEQKKEVKEVKGVKEVKEKKLLNFD